MNSRLTRRTFGTAQAAAVLWTRRYHHSHPSWLFSSGGLQTSRGGRRLLSSGPSGSALTAALGGRRSASFARLLPKLMLKFVRIPAMFGGLMIGGVAWVQYQAIQVSNSASELVGNMKDTVKSTASSVWGSAIEVVQQTKRGWDSTKEQAEVPEWMRKVLRLQEEIGSGEEGGSSSGGSGGGEGSEENGMMSKGTGAAAVAGASAAAYGYEQSGEDDDRSAEEIAHDDQMMILTKKMIEIRNILQKVGRSSSLSLPSIVVIGSQSSGKSSVLEAIVGHEFLPKGSNMVTRRPIELTLVNTPDSRTEYGEFSDLGRKMTDFSDIQRTLTELNLSVPDEVCVSDDPIHLKIYSPNVPDLSLIDLPGYIQVVGQNQPLELKRKIADLCDKYVQPPNVILAISAADVDLANSTALQASRKVDPRGERTIGVITKLDLVDAARASVILRDNQYPLRLGYVGVVAKAPQPASLFKKGPRNLLATVARNENAYFSSHPREFGPGSGVSVGTTTLRKKLMHVLEQTMSASLKSTNDTIKQELAEANYQFKAQYNDRPISADSYLAQSLDEFKHAYKEMVDTFGPEQMQQIVKNELDQRVLDILAERYWNKPISDLSVPPREPENIADLPVAEPNSLYWNHQLDASVSALTMLGVGRLGTTLVTSAIQDRIDKLISESPFANHPLARQAIREAATTVLNERFPGTSDLVEIGIKPFKFNVKVEEPEWDRGRDHAAHVLKAELEQCQAAIRKLENAVGGRRKLREVMSFVEKARRGEVEVEGESKIGAGSYSAALLARGREAVFLRDRADIINMRLQAVKSKPCRKLKNKQHCPEVFLDAVATKLANQAALFLEVELLEGFYYQFPRELDARLGRRLSDEQVERLAKENPHVKRHLDLIQRRELLELALDKIKSLRQLEDLEKGRLKEVGEHGRARGGSGPGSWVSLF